MLSFRYLALVSLLAGTSLLHAAGPNTSKRAVTAETPAKSDLPVAALVGNEPVYQAEVDDILAGARKGKGDVEPAAELRGPALEQAINRRLVAQYLGKEGYAIDEEETKELISVLKRKLEAQKITFEEFLKRHGFNELMVRRRLQWDIMWAQFVANQANDEALEEYFDSHRREYDGTELRVSHILWAVKPADDPVSLAAAMKEAEEVRARIVASKVTFAEAAKKYSAGPSRRSGGDLGFIPLHGLMTEAFSRAAFELKPGDVSKPVADQFGVHLITCTGEKPGERTWRDVRRELIAALSREKFLELAALQRTRVEVKTVDESQ